MHLSILLLYNLLHKTFNIVLFVSSELCLTRISVDNGYLCFLRYNVKNALLFLSLYPGLANGI